MDPARVLNREQMETARTPDELYAWVRRKCKELSRSPEAKAYARSGKPLPKKLYDELFPLAIFVSREYRGRTDVRVQPHLGNDNFDATVTFSGQTEQALFIETTYAKDGYDESLRMEVLAKEGHVFLTGSVSKFGRRGAADRVVTVSPQAASRAEQLEEYLGLVHARLKAKANRRYGAHHVLLVAVDDYLPLAQDHDWPIVDQRARSWMADLALDFGRIVFVGVAERLLLSYSLPLTTGGVHAL